MLNVSACGLILFVYKASDKTGRLLYIEEPVDPGTAAVPHHPVLITTRAAWATTLPQYSPMFKFSEPEVLGIANPVALDLRGAKVTIGGGAGALRDGASMTRGVRIHPAADEEAHWSDIAWLPNLSVIHPGCTLKPDYSKLGNKVKTEVILGAGVIAGGMPLRWSGGDWVWAFSPTALQAATDHFTYKPDNPVMEIVWPNGQSTTMEFPSGKDAHLLLLHEADDNAMNTDASIANIARRLSSTITGDPRDNHRPYMTHFSHLYKALDNLVFPGLGVPLAIWQWNQGRVRPLPLQDTAYCTLAKIDV